MSEGDETNMQWNFIPLNKAERFDRVDVRGFCEKHHRRGGAGLDDADINYKLVMVRI